MATPVEGLTRTASDFGVSETLDRVEVAARERGMIVFARIDHAAGARDVGLELRPMQLVLIGAARAGTPLMQSAPALGIDLPLKLLAWEDAEGRTWLAYQEPAWLAARHGLASDFDAAIGKMGAGLAAIAQAAVRR